MKSYHRFAHRPASHIDTQQSRATSHRRKCHSITSGSMDGNPIDAFNWLGLTGSTLRSCLNPLLSRHYFSLCSLLPCGENFPLDLHHITHVYQDSTSILINRPSFCGYNFLGANQSVFYSYRSLLSWRGRSPYWRIKSPC